MRPGKVLLLALVLLLVLVVLIVINPESRMVLQEVNLTLLTEAEAQGLMDAELPMGASSIVRDGREINGAVTGEMRFKLRGVKWVYHCAAADALTDVSGVEGDFDALDTEVMGCPAQVFHSADGVGKIIWFDEAAGKAHSLVMETKADGDALQSIANMMQAAK